MEQWQRLTITWLLLGVIGLLIQIWHMRLDMSDLPMVKRIGTCVAMTMACSIAGGWTFFVALWALYKEVRNGLHCVS